jgi:PleD family two-component response regulator/EAL domain-containing protein (putative c-di-GMP-specific phosphodiesterase class I)
MAVPPDTDSTTTNEARATFLQQLPKRLAAIEEIWTKLEHGPWERDKLNALYHRIREISEASKQHSMFQLNESVFSLEVYLSSFVDSDISPGASQISAIDGLVRALKTSVAIPAAAASSDTAEATAETSGIFVLAEDTEPFTGVMAALGDLGCQVERFDDADSLLTRLEASPPRVIVADTAKLPGITPLSNELVRLRSHASVNIPLMFISRSTTLQLRVDAIRAGGDGYLVTPVEAEAVAKQIHAMAMPEPQAPARVLIVEDDPTQADFAGSILRKAGIEVLQVTDPVRVLDSLAGFKPDLILMDIYMPEVNGIELTTIIRDHQEFVTTPIVFLSGEQNADKQLDALSVGGDDFVAKPIRPKHLLSVVQTRIRRARQIREATGQPPKHDRVTGLFSRQHLIDRIATTLDDTARSAPAGLLFIEPDDSQALARKLGVGGVDHLMSLIGETIAAHLGATDVAARLDDSAFGVLARRERKEELTTLAEHLVQQLANSGSDGDVSGNVSVGLCMMDDRHDDANGIIRRAAIACEKARAHGGHRVHLHMSEADSEEITVESDEDFGQRVQSALRDDGFSVLYQPLLDLEHRGSENYEIVLKLQNATGDLVGDRSLQEAAEATGNGEALDRWALECAMNILKQRRDSGRRTRIFIRQSAHSALNTDLPAWLLGRLRTKQMVGTGLVVDFRLQDLSKDLKIAQKTIHALREMDVEVSLSMFPEKDAAFKVLTFLRANYISITPRLLKAQRQVISSVITRAHEASAKVIVSHVDDPRSIDLHWSSGADFLQGNFIQRPLEHMDYDFSQVVI